MRYALSINIVLKYKTYRHFCPCLDAYADLAAHVIRRYFKRKNMQQKQVATTTAFTFKYDKNTLIRLPNIRSHLMRAFFVISVLLCTFAVNRSKFYNKLSFIDDVINFNKVWHRLVRLFLRF